MRTTLDIDDDLMERLIERHRDLSKTEAIETAIRCYLQRDAADRLRALAGQLDVEDVSAELRRADRTT
ncbi:MAG: type II toxin-antitoxin system VapB family antitoxin [Actinobacteria bacterium]|nr:type II toxin-antitoxin system VapB family antitoxin [Actinomycetota bacterium]